MPGHHRLRPLKAWRYVGVFSPELMICVAAVRIGPVRQAFWAVWDRRRGALAERTVIGRGGGRRSAPGASASSTARVQLELALEEVAGIESVCPSGDALRVDAQAGRDRRPRATCASTGEHASSSRAGGRRRHRRVLRAPHAGGSGRPGIGTETGGRPVAWNLVAGVNDPPARQRADGVGRRRGARMRRRARSHPTSAPSTTSRFTAEAERVSRREPGRSCAAGTGSRSAPSPARCPGGDRARRAASG